MKKKWYYFNIFLFSFVFILGGINAWYASSSQVRWDECLTALIFIPILLVIFFGLNAKISPYTRWKKFRWDLKISLDSSLFAAYLYFTIYVFLFYSFPALLIVLITRKWFFLPEVVLNLNTILGLWIGLKISKKLFKKNFGDWD